MVISIRSLAAGAALVMLLVSCAQPTSPSAGSPAGSGTAAPQPAAAPKHFTAAIRGLAVLAYEKLNPRQNIPGETALERLVNTGLTVQDPQGNGRIPRLAEAAPTLDNGLWKLNDDGTMDTTWTIRQGALWSDGTPFTTDDLLFTIQVVRDKDLPVFDDTAYNSLGTVEALDSQTIVAHWTRPYIHADQLFSFDLALPMARHNLEQTYQNDKDHFIDSTAWGPDIVGAGPFRVRDWEMGSSVTLEANDRYIDGRPNIDEITVEFIPDPDTLGANILSGAVETEWGDRIDIEWAQSVADKWQVGTLSTNYLTDMLQIFPQMMGSTPPIISQSADFRRAMLMALDRQSMADTFQLGHSSIGHTFIAPTEPEYPYLESSIVKYDYDPDGALQLLAGLGFTKGADGVLRDQSGQQLSFQVRTSQGDVTQEDAQESAVDNWKRLGVDAEPFLVPPQEANDAPFRATFPSFDVKRQAGTMDYAKSFLSTNIALPENNFLVSGNNSRYSRPDMDAAIDSYFTTVPWDDRMNFGRQIVHELSDDVGWMGLYYVVDPALVPNRVTGRRTATTELNELDFINTWDLQ